MEGRPVAGFIYATPPVRLIDEHADLGQSVQQHMARRLAEIELLAVESLAQGRGLGTALLAEMENNLRQRGVGVVLVKIRASISTIRWYLQRGYTLADLTAPTLLRLGGNVITCGDGADGHCLALKPLRNQPVHDATTVFRP